MIVLFADSFFVALQKPAGTATESCIEQLRGEFGGFLEAIHRLDQPVSGVLLCARSAQVVAQVQRELVARRLYRAYIAVCERAPDPPAGVARHTLFFDRRANRTRVAHNHGKESELVYATLGHTDRYTVVRVELRTGRHHQIRAQLAALGSPIVGDLKYGARRSRPHGGVALHALELECVHPLTGQRLRFHAPLNMADGLWRAAYDVWQDAADAVWTSNAAPVG